MVAPMTHAIAAATVAATRTGGQRATHTAGRAPSVTIASPATTIRAAVDAFNAANCAAIYAVTAPWVRGHQARADTIAACAHGFADGRRQGVTLLRLTPDGPGRYVSTGAYRQPLLLRRVMQGRTTLARETMQLVHVGARWYVLALW